MQKKNVMSPLKSRAYDYSDSNMNMGLRKKSASDESEPYQASSVRTSTLKSSNPYSVDKSSYFNQHSDQESSYKMSSDYEDYKYEESKHLSNYNETVKNQQPMEGFH